jgi:hypothetical protein
VENQPVVGWLGGQWHPLLTRVQIPDLTLWCLTKAENSFSGRRCSRRQRDTCDDFVNLKILRRSLLEVPIKVECVCVHRDTYLRLRVSVFNCFVFRKK